MRRLARSVVRGCAPVALLATGACFATSSDVQQLSANVQSLRADQVRADSARARELAQVSEALGVVRDSLTTLSARMLKMQGDVRGDLYSMGQQLISIQELTGQSQRRLQELRSSMEQRQQEISGAAPTSPTGGAPTPATGVTGAPTTPASPTAPAGAGATPGPNQLFQLSLQQLQRGSAGAAQQGFQTLLQQYPTSDLVPDAQFYLGEAYRAEGNAAAADSAYAVVVERYPQSPRAATALYKRALAMEEKGNLTGARAALNQLIQKYPRSDEAALAREHLRTMK